MAGLEEFWRRLEGCSVEQVYLATLDLVLLQIEIDEILDAWARC